MAVVFTGPLAGKLGALTGVGSTGVQSWDLAKWPVMALIVGLILSILYYFGPDVRQPGFRWVSPGSAVAVVAWVVVSGLFAFNVANFSSYKTYGALASVVVFLVWLWITNVVILFGAELTPRSSAGARSRAGIRRMPSPICRCATTPMPDRQSRERK